MMPPAMTTPPDERLAYANLARQGAHVQRRLPAAALPRLGAIAVGKGVIDVDLKFRLDGSGRPRVEGRVSQLVETACQRCLERFDHRLSVEFDVCIMREGAAATEAAERTDVLVAEGESVSIADIVEDELLLGLPDRLCRTEPCPHAPALSYPAAGEEPADEPAESASPFSVLSKLKRADS
jgi:uncharacterized protein